MMYKLQHEIYSIPKLKFYRKAFKDQIDIGRCLRDRYISNSDYESFNSRSCNELDGFIQFASDVGYELYATTSGTLIDDKSNVILFNVTNDRAYYSIASLLIKIWLYGKYSVQRSELDFAAATASEMMCPYDSLIYDICQYNSRNEDLISSVTLGSMYHVGNEFINVKIKRMGIENMITTVSR